MKKKKIPTDEEFARAKAIMKIKNSGLDEIAERVKQHYRNDKLHDFFIFYSIKFNVFGAYVFFESTNDIASAESSGLLSDIRNFIYIQLKNRSKMEDAEINLEVEFDSHENVTEHYDGNYFDRMR